MLRRLFLVALASVALEAGLSCPLSADTCFVDQEHPRASHENGGTEASPWKTINHAATVLRALPFSATIQERAYTSPIWYMP